MADTSQMVLLVEDDEGVAELQRRRLSRAGYQVILASTEQRALEVLHSSNVDLMVLDFKLAGDRTGLQFYEQLKESGYHLPVIMVTGCNQESVAIAALRAGVCDYVSKSVEYLDYLPEAVARVLHQVNTERSLRQVESQLRHSQKMEAIGRLAGSVAHDFNNFLSVIIGCSEGALDELRQDDPIRELVQDVYDAGKRAATLTRQLLTFSRRGEYEPAEIDLNVVITEIEPMLQRLIGHEIQLQLQLATRECLISADKGQLDQLLLNLVVNARDAISHSGSILISTAVLRTGSIRLTVADSGCGMTPETKSRIFEPFFTTKGPHCGTGLGLATVYGVVQQAGGRIDVQSEPSCGTSFLIDFPAIKTESEVQPSNVIDGISTLGGESNSSTPSFV